MINNYKFKIGDEVITTSGIRGRIIDICKCEECKKRGFYEPVWTTGHNNYEDCITSIEAELCFPSFYKIGDYHFRDFDRTSIRREMVYHQQQIDELAERLRFMNEIESVQED